MRLFAVCAPGLEPLLAGELRALGVEGRAVGGGVELEGDLALALRLNLWLRTATRVLVRLGEVHATAFPELVKKARALPWETALTPGRAASLRVTCRKSRLYHSDAVAERLHAALEARLGGKVPLAAAAGEDDDAPAQLFVARFERDVCTVSADTSGALLHRRGWRATQGHAPLRETLAAALLLGAGYTGDTPLCDPLCGSGTVAIEGALIARRRAPGLLRRFAVESWPGVPRDLRARLDAEARAQERAAPAWIEASDAQGAAVAAARTNAARAGVELELAERDLAALPQAAGPGLVACNPPYGVRLEGDADALHRLLGRVLRERRPGWGAAVVLAHERLGRATGLPLRRIARTQNGGLPIELARTDSGAARPAG